jgi:tetratricopeptide (TPR) repeat protein/tRNA A-37 threonylcarbamoyl transferase component Bud32
MTRDDRARDLLEHLADVFMEDVGLRDSQEPTPAVLDDEEFARIAMDLGFVDAAQIEAARVALGEHSELRLWDQLERVGALDIGDVLSVYRYHSELCSYASRTVGRYLVVERRGQGASGRVYRAIHQDLLKHVALKILTLGEDAPRSVVERFRREAATAAGLRHPGIVGVHDVGVDGDLHYIAMDLVEGVTLDQWTGKEPGRDAILAVLENVARAVGFAHEEGVLHRDLKPHNILVQPDGRPVVVDFGLARAQSDATLTRDGAVLGTPRYMAPEQVRGEVQSLTPAADVYALGIVLHECLAGERPFTESDAGLPVLVKGSPRLDDRVRALLGTGLAAVCAKCLEPDPRDRYADATELAEELERVQAGMPVKAKPITALMSLARRLRRRAWTVVGATAAVALLVLGGVLGWELLERNRRLEYAGDVKTAYTVLRARLEPWIDEAEELRYSEADEGRRAALFEGVRLARTGVDDSTGVGEAYGEWVRFLVREPDASERLKAVRDAHPQNPFPALVCAWTHLRAYADAVRWPADEEVLLHPLSRGGESPVFMETEAMRVQLAAAAQNMERARASGIWNELSELSWVEDLALGFEHYAQGDFEAAIEHLERVGGYNDLPFEPALILSFAYSRRGDLEGAFKALEVLVQRRPEHATAKRALAAFYKRRAIDDLRSKGGGLDDMQMARGLMFELSSDPSTDAKVAYLDLVIALARGRRGESGIEEFNRALPVFERVLEQHPDDFGALGGLSQCLVNLGGEERLARAAEISERMLEMRPDHPPSLELRIGVHLMTLKERRGQLEDADLDDLDQRIVQAQERIGPQPTLQFYRLNLYLLRAQLAARQGEDLAPWLERTAEVGRELYANEPEFHRALFMAWWAESYLPLERRPAVGKLLQEVRELRTPFTERGVPSPFDPQLAQRLEQLASSAEDPEEVADLLALACALVGDLARVSPPGLPWQERRLRLANNLARVRPDEALRWRREEFEAARVLAAEGDGSTRWTEVLGAGARAFAAGVDDILQVTLEAGEEALRSGEAPATVHLLRAWLLTASGDDEGGAQELAVLTGLADRGPEFEARLGELNEFGWGVAIRPGGAAEGYARALAALELVTGLDPENAAALNTAGVLLYRVGEWERAMEVLVRSAELNSGGRSVSHPTDTAFLALCAHELGLAAEARRWSEELREGIKTWGLEDDLQTQGFLAEVETALGGS